ncbi:hypothetical protein RB608_21285 [Nocardioides sp. LHD-245]|uniref:hypothetical protein n=1 Tax=Nocardioides sp. LHD-245 TaxID=3051387 RepID=UPI0027DF37C6|nr:hypothetical protein [Nocardioides sp. LHD-245]
MKYAVRLRVSLALVVLLLGFSAGVLPSASADPVASAPTIISPTPGQVIRDQSFNVQFTRADGVSSVRIFIDEGTSAARTFDVSVSGAPVNVPGSGPHTIRIANIESDGSAGMSSPTQSFTLVLPPPGPPGISINAGAQYTNSRHVTLKVVWPAYYRDGMIIDNDGGFANFQSPELAATVPWTLVGSGDEKLPKTVYVRFVRVDPSFSGTTYSEQTFTDDIVLDLTSPVVKAATSTSSRGPVAQRLAARRYKVRVRATDKVSGVAQVQFATKKAHPRGLRKFDRKAFVLKKAPRFVRVVDLAGNYSAWKRIA